MRCFCNLDNQTMLPPPSKNKIIEEKKKPYKDSTKLWFWFDAHNDLCEEKMQSLAFEALILYGTEDSSWFGVGLRTIGPHQIELPKL